MSLPSINFVDLMSKNIMGSPTNLKDYIWKRELPKVTSRKSEKVILSIHGRQQQEVITKETIEKENVQICIQNDEKLISFLSNIRSRKSITCVVFTSASNIMILIKSYNLHPVLIMKYPIDDTRVYSRSAGLVYELPLDDLVAKALQGVTLSDGYALYYRKMIDAETKQTRIMLCFKTPRGEDTNLASVQDVNIEYINRLLQPPLQLDKQIVMTTRGDDKISQLNDISLMMLIDVHSISVFKEMCRDQSIVFKVEPDDNGILSMRYASEIDEDTKRRPLANERDTMIWQFKSSITYHMYDRTAILLQSSNSKIKTGSDFLYFAFGRYGSEYVFLKLITTRAITQEEVSAPVVVLSSILATTNHMFEMYFCHV